MTLKIRLVSCTWIILSNINYFLYQECFWKKSILNFLWTLANNQKYNDKIIKIIHNLLHYRYNFKLHNNRLYPYQLQPQAWACSYVCVSFSALKEKWLSESVSGKIVRTRGCIDADVKDWNGWYMHRSARLPYCTILILNTFQVSVHTTVRN